MVGEHNNFRTRTETLEVCLDEGKFYQEISRTLVLGCKLADLSAETDLWI